MNILVTNGESYTSLSVVRNLKKNNHNVFVISSDPQAPVARSRYVDDFSIHDEIGYEILFNKKPIRNELKQKNFVRWLEEKVDTWNIGYILLNSENVIVPFVKYATRELKDLGSVPDKNLLKIIDKESYLDALNDCISEIPYTCFPSSRKELEGIINNFTLPVIVKPRIGSGGMREDLLCKTRKEVLQKFEEIEDLGRRSVVQEYIKGIPKTYQFILNDNSKIKCFFGAYFKDDSMVSSLEADIIKVSKKIFNKLELTGPVNIQFIEKSGKNYVIDINPRFSGGITDFAIESGIDLPKFLLNDDNNFFTMDSYKTGNIFMLPQDFIKKFICDQKKVINLLISNRIVLDRKIFYDPIPCLKFFT